MATKLVSQSSGSIFFDQSPNIEQLQSALDKYVGDFDGNRMDTMGKLTKWLTKCDVHLKSELKLHALLACIRNCQIDSTKELRTMSYRALEQILSTNAIHIIFKEFHFDIFFVRAIIRDSRYDSERQQVMRVILRVLEHPDGHNILPLSIVRVLVSLADQLDDRLRNSAVCILCEYAIRNPAYASYTSALKTIFSAIMDGPDELIIPVIKSYLYMIDGPQTRQYIRPHLELEVVISMFTDAYTAKGAISLDKLKPSILVLEEIFNSWTGLYFFSLGNFQAIYSIIEVLSFPNEGIQNIILEFLQEILGISKNRCVWYQQFRGMRLMTFIDAGIMEALISVVQTGESSTCKLSFILIADILTQCALQLPKLYNDKVQSLPSLFATASNFQNESIRHDAREKLTTIFRTHVESITQSNATHNLGEVQIELFRIKNSMNMDETRFRNLLNDSEVLGINHFSKWNWDAISEIIKGPLLNLKRFDELAKVTKFVTRIIHFLRPSSRQFSDLMAESSSKIVDVCCDFICNLASTPFGSKFLTESKLLQDIAERFAKLVDPANIVDSFFSKDALEHTLVRAYFTIIGKLQLVQEGEGLLNENNIWSFYYQLTELRGRDDIARLIITTGNYAVDGHMRIILSKLLSSGYKEMRLYATQYLEVLLENKVENLHEWVPEVALAQLYDSSEPVVKTALKLLKIGTTNQKFLESVILCKPNISQITQFDNSIVYQFLRYPEGVQFLTESKYIQEELNYWYEHGLYQYVTATELFMQDIDSTCDPIYSFPPHFIGSLASTTEGCTIIQEQGQISDLLIALTKLATSSSDVDIFKLKAVLWTIGHIGSSESGFDLLQTFNTLTKVLNLLRKSLVLSVRATCVFILGLFSRSIKASEQLEKLGWNIKDGICLPETIDTFFDIPKWTYLGSWPNHRSLTFSPLKIKFDSAQQEILKCIGNLTNHIIASAASKRLTTLKQVSPELFNSPYLFIQAIRLTSDYQFRIPSRRFVQDLFDKVVWTDEVVKIIDEVDGLCLNTPYTTDKKKHKKRVPLMNVDESNIQDDVILSTYEPKKTSQGFLIKS
ncbi:Rapamycin-insensitive companion of mTOR, middle domain-containing protein [Globomyces pollinis-pini]|nr:Rapamycin-insensitive companion of mTOR, middle domain-containing protein [Globomyces pollinis-pini]